MDIAIMLEGQNGLTWPKWQKLAHFVEEKGFAGLYRSDHFTNAGPPDMESLECWTSLTWLASHTERLEFGPLVSPLSFRHPTMLARFACAVDDLSGGRLQFGVGAGWQEREHHNFSWDLLEIPDRMQRFEEALEIMTQLLRSGGPVTFEGQYYQVYDAVVLPRPARVGGPPIVIGGNGPKRTLPLAAKYANEWNAVYLTGDRFAERSDLLTALLEKQGRSAGDVRRTMMTGCVYSSSEKKLAERLESSGRKKEDLQSDGMIVGSGDDFTQQLKKLQDAGVQRVMLQWINLDDLDELSKMAELILPEFHL